MLSERRKDMRNDVINHITLDLGRQTANKSVSMKRNDTNTRTLHFTLMNEGEIYTLENILIANIRGVKPDGTIFYNDCVIDGDEIHYEVTNQTIATAGEVICELVLMDRNNEEISSSQFAIVVYDSLFGDNVMESVNEYLGLKALVTACEKSESGCAGAEERIKELLNKVIASQDATEKIADLAREYKDICLQSTGLTKEQVSGIFDKILDVQQEMEHYITGADGNFTNINDFMMRTENELTCNLLHIADFSYSASTGGTHCINGNYGCSVPDASVTVWSGEITLPEGGYTYPASSDTADVLVIYALDGTEHRVEISSGAVLPEGAVVTEYRLERKEGESRITADIWPMISPGKRAVPEFVPYTGDKRQMNRCVADIAAPRYSMPKDRENLVPGEKLKNALGKIGRFFSDLKEVAFSGSYNDLEDKPSAEDIGAFPISSSVARGDFNAMTTPGVYMMFTNKNAPTTYEYWSLTVTKSDADKISQIAISNYGRDFFIRSGDSTGRWQDWEKTLMVSCVANNLVTTNAGYALDARQGKVLQDEISGINEGLSQLCSDYLEINIPYHSAYIMFIRVGQYCIAHIYHYVAGLTWDTAPYSIRIPEKYRPAGTVDFHNMTYLVQLHESGIIGLWGSENPNMEGVKEYGFSMYRCVN